MNFFLRMLIKVFIGYLLVAGTVFVFQRKMLYHPTHRNLESVLQPWEVNGETLGYARTVEHPSAVWLVCHGNGGQAAMRSYLLEQVADDTAFYVLEYPGFGDRPGKPSLKHINAAAAEAYAHLQEMYPELPVGLIGESLGSGPASHLAQATPQPDKIVLLVPYDQLYRVAAKHMPMLPVKWLLRDKWDNIAALQDYPGSVEVYAAEDDEVIPVERAKALAAALPQARLIMMPGGHDTWRLDEKFELTAGLDLEGDATSAVKSPEP